MTDNHGLFSFDGLVPGRYRVWANLGSATSRTKRAKGEVVMVAESGPRTRSVELRLAPAVRVNVRVIDRATGKPIDRATVQPGWSDFVDDFTTGRDGAVAAQPFTAERWLLDAWADGFARQSRWINLENGAAADVEFALDPGGDLEGTVRDASGNPVAGLGLSVAVAGRVGQFAYSETDARGRYCLGNMPLNFLLQIEHTGYGNYLREAITTRVTGRRQVLDLTIKSRPHGGSITGAVVDQAGRPIAGAELINPGNSSDVFREARTGPDGRYRLDNLYESVIGKELIVRSKGYAPRA